MEPIYCAECGGTVNRGGACPYAKQPANCPLEKTEKEHHADLAKQAAAKAKPAPTPPTGTPNGQPPAPPAQ